MLLPRLPRWRPDPSAGPTATYWWVLIRSPSSSDTARVTELRAKG